MSELIIKDAGGQYTIQINEDKESSVPIVPQVAPHVRFIEWWKFQCNERRIPYHHHGAAGLRITKTLLAKHTYQELQLIAVRFMLDYGGELSHAANHFVLFTQRAPQIAIDLANEV